MEFLRVEILFNLKHWRVWFGEINNSGLEAGRDVGKPGVCSNKGQYLAVGEIRTRE